MKKLIAAILIILSIGAGTVTAMADPTQPPGGGGVGTTTTSGS